MQHLPPPLSAVLFQSFLCSFMPLEGTHTTPRSPFCSTFFPGHFAGALLCRSLSVWEQSVPALGTDWPPRARTTAECHQQRTDTDWALTLTSQGPRRVDIPGRSQPLEQCNRPAKDSQVKPDAAAWKDTGWELNWLAEWDEKIGRWQGNERRNERRNKRRATGRADMGSMFGKIWNYES